MKPLIYLISGMLILQNIAQAQLPSVPGNMNAGKLLVELINNIKPSSMISSFAGKKGELISNAAKAVTGPALAKNISLLAGFIKPGLLKNGFNLKSLQQSATTAKSITDAVGLMKNLEGGIKPEGMVDSWDAKRTNWSSSLDQVK